MHNEGPSPHLRSLKNRRCRFRRYRHSCGCQSHRRQEGPAVGSGGKHMTDNKKSVRYLLRRRLRQIHGDCCHWCGNRMLFDVTVDNKWFSTIEHLDDSVFSDQRNSRIDNLRLAHRICNQRRNRYGFRNKDNIKRFDDLFDGFIRFIQAEFKSESLHNSI